MKATNNITANILKSLALISAVFFFQLNTIKAEGYNTTVSTTLTINTLITVLAPSAPLFTDFNDAELNATDFLNLAPSAPAEADFNETPESMIISSLAPTTPAEADFSDSYTTVSELAFLAPTAPASADFND